MQAKHTQPEHSKVIIEEEVGELSPSTSQAGITEGTNENKEKPKAESEEKEKKEKEEPTDAEEKPKEESQYIFQILSLYLVVLNLLGTISFCFNYTFRYLFIQLCK